MSRTPQRKMPGRDTQQAGAASGKSITEYRLDLRAQHPEQLHGLHRVQGLRSRLCTNGQKQLHHPCSVIQTHTKSRNHVAVLMHSRANALLNSLELKSRTQLAEHSFLGKSALEPEVHCGWCRCTSTGWGSGIWGSFLKLLTAV